MTFIRACWLAFVIVWAITAARTKQTRVVESFGGQLLYRAVTVVAVLLIFPFRITANVLPAPIFPSSQALYYVACAVTVIGILFAFWARFHLGQNWSGNVTIKADHELIRTGPYARIRHPIYTGILLALLGTGLAANVWRAVLGFALAILAFWIKARREEAVLEKEFGDRFAEHLRLTGMFLPRLS